MRTKKEIRITTIIGKGAECNGDFSAQGSVRIDGCVRGNVTVTDTLVIGTTGYIEGDISAKGVIIGGEVMGNVNAPERAELTANARVIGDICTSIIVVDEHAVFQGKCDMNQEVPGKRVKPGARAMRAGRKSAKAAIEEALKEVEAANKESVTTEAVAEDSI